MNSVERHYSLYTSVVVTAIQKYYKPIDQCVSSKNLAMHILDDPGLWERFGNIERSRVQKIITTVLLKGLGAERAGHAHRTSHCILPVPVGQLTTHITMQEVQQCAA